MEKAILKTIIYADIFDYPLKAWEIHKWLIGSKSTLTQVEVALKKLLGKSKIKEKNGYFYLAVRKGLVEKRLRRQKQSAKYLSQARLMVSIFKLVPQLKLIGISGNLAMDNSEKSDDIDLFVITAKNKLWSTRIFLLLILSVFGKRRMRGDKRQEASGKICVNLLLEEDNLEQKNKDLYTAHEVLQMKVLWQRGGIYSKFLEENSWAFKFLPNWTSGVEGKITRALKNKKSQPIRGFYTIVLEEGFEYAIKSLQLRYMGKPQGKERISGGALYFHPEDYREKILGEFKKRVAKFI